MSMPSILFAAVLSTLYGAGFHLWRGGSAGKLLLFLVLSWIGFAAGQIFAARLEWTFDLFGQTHLVVASLSSLIFLVIGNWLAYRTPVEDTD